MSATIAYNQISRQLQETNSLLESLQKAPTASSEINSISSRLSAHFDALSRSIQTFESLVKQEVTLEKREIGLSRLRKVKEELDLNRNKWDEWKRDKERRDRESLLGSAAASGAKGPVQRKFVTFLPGLAY